MRRAGPSRRARRQVGWSAEQKLLARERRLRAEKEEALAASREEYESLLPIQRLDDVAAWIARLTGVNGASEATLIAQYWLPSKREILDRCAEIDLELAGPGLTLAGLQASLQQENNPDEQTLLARELFLRMMRWLKDRDPSATECYARALARAANVVHVESTHESSRFLRLTSGAVACLAASYKPLSGSTRTVLTLWPLPISSACSLVALSPEMLACHDELCQGARRNFRIARAARYWLRSDLGFSSIYDAGSIQPRDLPHTPRPWLCALYQRWATEWSDWMGLAAPPSWVREAAGEVSVLLAVPNPDPPCAPQPSPSALMPPPARAALPEDPALPLLSASLRTAGPRHFGLWVLQPDAAASMKRWRRKFETPPRGPPPAAALPPTYKPELARPPASSDPAKSAELAGSPASLATSYDPMDGLPRFDPETGHVLVSLETSAKALFDLLAREGATMDACVKDQNEAYAEIRLLGEKLRDGSAGRFRLAHTQLLWHCQTARYAPIILALRAILAHLPAVLAGLAGLRQEVASAGAPSTGCSFLIHPDLPKYCLDGADVICVPATFGPDDFVPRDLVHAVGALVPHLAR
jgi:hypothetical protein